MITSPTTNDQVMAGASDELVCQLPPHSRIKLIGLGGIGCIVLEYLAMFLKSLNQSVRLVLIDGDEFDETNSSRMHFRRVGNKAEIKVQETLDRLGSCDVSVVAVPKYVTVENVFKLIVPGDHVIMCVDNHPTRKLVSDHCETLSDVVLFSGGNDGVVPEEGQRGTYGNVQIHIRRDAKNLTVPITRFHPEIAKAVGKMPTDADCGVMALSTPQILFANLAVASVLLNSYFAYTCGQLGYQEVTLDILDARILPQLRMKTAGGKSGTKQGHE